MVSLKKTHQSDRVVETTAELSTATGRCRTDRYGHRIVPAGDERRDGGEDHSASTRSAAQTFRWCQYDSQFDAITFSIRHALTSIA